MAALTYEGSFGSGDGGRARRSVYFINLHATHSDWGGSSHFHISCGNRSDSISGIMTRQKERGIYHRSPLFDCSCKNRMLSFRPDLCCFPFRCKYHFSSRRYSGWHILSSAVTQRSDSYFNHAPRKLAQFITHPVATLCAS